MHYYIAYGLSIQSELEMPELKAGQSAPPDVTIRFGQLEAKTGVAPSEDPVVTAEKGNVLLYWDQVGSVEIRNGSEIIIDPIDGAEESVLRHILQGVSMGILLDQRGYFTLHASAVAMDGKVVAFIGWKRMGKSTTAAALHTRGYPLVTDDVLALDFNNSHDGIRVLPGAPSLKLWPDAARLALGDTADDLPRIFSPSTKRSMTTGNGLHDATLTLGRIYVLDYIRTGNGPLRIEPLKAPEACVQMVSHSYALRFLGERGASAEHLHQCTRIVREIPVKRLVRRKSLEEMDRLTAAIVADMSACETQNSCQQTVVRLGKADGGN